MKSILKIWLLGLLMQLNLSCSSGNDPRYVAEDFAECIYTADFEHAYDYVTTDASEVVKFIEAMSSKYVEKLQESDPEIRVLSCEVDEKKGTAKVKLEIKNYYDLDKKMINPEPETETYDLKKVDDKWLIVLNGK